MTEDADAPTGRNLWRWAPVAGFAALAAVFMTGLWREDGDALPSPLIDKPAPEFSLPALREGAPGFSSADLTAEGVKVVNIWASWCGPCRVEHPELMKLAEAGVPVYGVNYKDQAGNAIAFLDELGDPYALTGFDEKGRAGIEWGVYGVPETFVIDGRGRIVFKHIGPIQNDDLEVKLMPAIEAARE